MIVTPPVITDLKLTKDNKTIGSLKMCRKERNAIILLGISFILYRFFSNGTFV